MRSQIAALGEPEAVRRALDTIAKGADKATVRDFATILGRLALHYWRPDFTPEQAKLLYGDFVRLLDGLTAAELRRAADAWVMDPLNRFFPTPGQLLELEKDAVADRQKCVRGAEYLLDLLDRGTAPDEATNRAEQLRTLADKMRVGGRR